MLSVPKPRRLATVACTGAVFGAALLGATGLAHADDSTEPAQLHHPPISKGCGPVSIHRPRPTCSLIRT